MPVYSGENPKNCCSFIDQEKIKPINQETAELVNLLNTFTVKLRGTEHNNCSICEYKDRYREKGLCYKPFEDGNRIKDATFLKKCFEEEETDAK